jgi:Fe-S-cluster containining protein
MSSSCLCDQCSALCCRYFVLEIDAPQTRQQYDDIRWYLVHQNVFVFIEKRKWYLGIYSRCKHLQADNRCGIYETRPRICREYSTENCDYHGGEYDWEVLFSSAEQLWEYAEEQLAAKAAKQRRARLREQKIAARKSGNAVATPVSAKTTKATRPARKRNRKLPKLLPGLVMTPGPAVLGRVHGNGNGSRPGANGNGNGKGVALPVLRG